MRPETVKSRKEEGLETTQSDMLWVLDLCEELAKALTSLDSPDFRCVVCGQEDDHSARCSVRLGEAVLAGRWKVAPPRTD